MDDLIARLQAAVGPSRELDGLIFYSLFGGEGVWYDFDGMWMRQDPKDTVAWEYPPHYTASLDAALTLIPDGAEYEITTLYGVARVAVGINMEPGPYYASREDGNAAIALTIAALFARAAK